MINFYEFQKLKSSRLMKYLKVKPTTRNCQMNQERSIIIDIV